MTGQLGMPRFRFYLTLASLLLLLSFWSITPAQARSLDEMSFEEWAQYLHEADSRQITLLAQRQFSFEIDSDYSAQAEDYLLMQESIAQRIPNEFSRPVFDVRFVFGDKAAVSDRHTIGILGGTGPISDASISKLIMDQLHGDDLVNGSMIHLFSLPPPRTTQEKIWGGVVYGARLATFMRRGYAEYFLASNTAHLNRKSLELLSGPGKIVDLPEIIAEKVAADQLSRGSRESILILGTTAAAEGRLYSGIFDNRHMTYAEIRPEQQSRLQEWIDSIKRGMLSPDARRQLKAFVAELATEHEAKDILLSCTELPLGLGSSLGELLNEGYFIYDTEKMMADIIAERFVL